MDFIPSPPTTAITLPAYKKQVTRARRKTRKVTTDVDVIAWDGEGFDDPEHDNRHTYALLASSLGTELKERYGLRSIDILKHVWQVGRAHKNALHVMYGANYDWNHWIKDIDYDTAKAVAKGHPITLGPYTVRYNSIWFEITRQNTTVTIWDVWKFWQQPFADALKGMFPDFDELSFIEEFKELRGRFEWSFMDRIAAYNRAELRGLVMMTQQLFKDLEIAGVPVPSYLTGAGALAGALLRRFHVNKHIGDQTFGSSEVKEAVLNAFAAGRVDAWKIGYHQGTCYQHDLRSAYPRAMVDLPSMASGEWVKTDKVTPNWEDRMSVWLVQWNYVPGVEHNCKYAEPPTRRYYPFFYRTRSGNIMFPPSGMGWQWWPEVMTAMSLGWKFKVLAGYTWYSEHPDIYPFDWIPRLYHQRAALKAAGKEGPQRVLKYGLNALYGKLAQARGYTADSPPALQNLAWAGWVTSATRARIMDVAHRSPNDVIYQMTDSVMALKRLNVDEGTNLGQWEIEECEAVLVAQAGVGSTWKHGKEVAKYRGFDVGAINAQEILNTWEINHQCGWENPVQTTVRRPVMLNTAVETEDRFRDWGQWQDASRDLDIYGGNGKRIGSVLGRVKPWQELCDLEPAPIATSENGPVCWHEYVDWCEMKNLDPVSTTYAPKYEKEDPWTLPEVQGKLALDHLNSDIDDGRNR